ncbi:sulfite exporter TauE/SafE family protein [Rhizobacter sp. J219]|uniref:sulfite exporter TauE/SafE family protein n=1 Tax=Rhizobacter sp. J219 TaxID=2898430 RepID=UPI002150DF56|nr:sulfite exporter TauE/SafE family protein [Rhizobacter sp. J219]MCR5884200.1 sulfite exporter TauE/SafE family protein [Rhizobacter sp. J219]
MSGAEIALLVVGAAVAGFVQGLSGFAFGMVAMSIWVWALDPKLAVVMSIAGGLSGQIFAAVRLRRGLQWPLLWPFLAGALVGVPLGVVVLPYVDAVIFKFGLGVTLMVCCSAMLMAQRIPRITRGGRIGDALAGAAGGVMGGLGGFTGVVPSFWCTVRGWDKDTARAVLQNFNLAALSVTFATYVGSGLVTREMWPLFLVVIPALLIPSVLGTRLYVGLSEAAFRRVVLGLLTVSGVVMIVSSVPVLLKR